MQLRNRGRETTVEREARPIPGKIHEESSDGSCITTNGGKRLYVAIDHAAPIRGAEAWDAKVFEHEGRRFRRYAPAGAPLAVNDCLQAAENIMHGRSTAGRVASATMLGALFGVGAVANRRAALEVRERGRSNDELRPEPGQAVAIVNTGEVPVGGYAYHAEQVATTTRDGFVSQGVFNDPSRPPTAGRIAKFGIYERAPDWTTFHEAFKDCLGGDDAVSIELEPRA